MEAGELDSSGREGEGPEILEASASAVGGVTAVIPFGRLQALDKGGIRGELFR